MESSIAVFPMRLLACELLPTEDVSMCNWESRQCATMCRAVGVSSSRCGKMDSTAHGEASSFAGRPRTDIAMTWLHLLRNMRWLSQPTVS